MKDEKRQTVPATPLPQVLTLGPVIAKCAGKHVTQILLLKYAIRLLCKEMDIQKWNHTPHINNLRPLVAPYVLSTTATVDARSHLGTDHNRYPGTKG